MNTTKIKRNLGFLLIFMTSFFLCVIVTWSYIRNKSQLEYIQMEQLVTAKSNKINSVITKLLYKTQILSALTIQTNGDVKNFEQIAATIIDDPAIKNVILAPDGVVTNIYPLEGNEAAIGLDYFSEGAGNKEAVAAKETGQLVLGGPFTLVQGGEALVGRYPVYLDKDNHTKQFWGLISVTLSYPHALDGAELDDLNNQGFAYEIWRINPDDNKRQIIACSDYDYNKNARYVEQPLEILNAKWYFKLSPIRNWYEYPETWVFTLCGFLISMLIAFLSIHNHDLKKMKLELEELSFHDPLTGVLNRRGVFKSMEEMVQNPNKPFVLCYFDLNHFKEINDTYGHNVGDQVLQQFAGIFKQRLDKHHIFSRIGGDEFVLIIRDSDDVNGANQFLESIRKKFQSTCVCSHEYSIYIAFSVGIAVFPVDGQTADDILIYADSDMYRRKKDR